jgi:hypothetical protein
MIDGLIGESTDASDRSVALDMRAEVTTACHFISSRVGSVVNIVPSHSAARTVLTLSSELSLRDRACIASAALRWATTSRA